MNPEAPTQSDNDVPSSAVPFWKRQVTERGAGVFLLFGGCFFAYLGIYLPLRAAMNHAPSISTSAKAAGMAPLLFGLGLIFVVWGKKARRFMGREHREGEQLTPAGWIITGVLVALGIAVHQWLKATLRGYGYGE